MRPKAGGLAQHGGPPVWLEESDPAGVIFGTRWRGCTACLFQLLLYSKCTQVTQPSVMSYVTQGRHGLHGTLVDQCRLSAHNSPYCSPKFQSQPGFVVELYLFHYLSLSRRGEFRF
jgi:hypothetical protein